MGFMAAAAIATSVLQANSAMQQGKMQQQMYNLKAKQAQLQGRQNALNYSQQAVSVLNKQRSLAATIFARAGAGGIDPFSGSPMSLNQYNAFKAGEEYNLGKENADMAIAGGLAQSQVLYQAGENAMASARANASVALASGALSAYSMATPAASAAGGASFGQSGGFTGSYLPTNDFAVGFNGSGNIGGGLGFGG